MSKKMQIMVGGRGIGKTYRLIIQLLINNGIFITQTSEYAKNINENMLPEIIKYLKEKTNIEYDCKEIAFCIDNFTTKSKKNKTKLDFVDEMFTSYAHSLKSNFKISTISGEYFNNYTYETQCLVDKNDNKEYAAVFECIWEKTDIGKGD